MGWGWRLVGWLVSWLVRCFLGGLLLLFACLLFFNKCDLRARNIFSKLTVTSILT